MARKKVRTLKAAADAQGDKVFRLTEIEPEFVSLVRAGANRQKSFLVVKADDEDVDKAVPDATASVEDKRKAQQARATTYGIEAREDGNLSYPAGSPTTEALYGDPVNLKYPFGGEDNEPDAARLRNALARFSQARDEYEDKASKVKILQRIIEASLAADIEVTYQDGDEIYQALPADLQERMGKTADEDRSGTGKDSTETENSPEGAADLASWLTEAGEKIQELSLDLAIQAAMDAPPAEHADVGPATKRAPEIVSTVAPTVAKVEEESEEKVAKLEAEVHKLRKENTALMAAANRLKATVGKSSVILTGEVTKRPQPSDGNRKSPSNGVFHRGGDIAAAVTRTDGR